jgi:hypothetical protein
MGDPPVVPAVQAIVIDELDEAVTVGVAGLPGRAAGMISK